MNVKSNYDTQLAYIHGRIEAQLEGFAASLEVPVRDVTTRVATLLLAAQSGPVLGTEDRVSTLSGNGTTRRKTSRQMAVAGSSYRRTPRKTSAIKQYWASMTKEERSAEMKRRLKKRYRNAQ